MVIVEHFTNGGWVDSCRHTLDESTAGDLEQLAITGGSTFSTVGRCSKCGEWFSLERAAAGLFDSAPAGDSEGVTS